MSDEKKLERELYTRVYAACAGKIRQPDTEAELAVENYRKFFKD